MYYYDIVTDKIWQKMAFKAEKCKYLPLDQKKNKYIITHISRARHNLFTFGTGRPWEHKRNHRKNNLLLHASTPVKKGSS